MKNCHSAVDQGLPVTIAQTFQAMEAGEVTRNQIVFFPTPANENEVECGARCDSHPKAAKYREKLRARRCPTQCRCVPACARHKGSNRAATEIEDVMAWTTVEGKVLGTFDIALNPEPGVGPAMHFFDPGRIFPAEFFPRRIFQAPPEVGAH